MAEELTRRLLNLLSVRAEDEGEVACGVVRLVMEGADPNRMVDGSLPLSVAITSGQSLAVLRCLVKLGAEVNNADSFGRTPLHRASGFSNHGDIVEFLLDAGAVVNVKDNDGESPLFDAVFRSDIRCVRLLLEAGADPNVLDNYDDSPLLLVFLTVRGNFDCFQLLLDWKARVSRDILCRAVEEIVTVKVVEELEVLEEEQELPEEELEVDLPEYEEDLNMFEKLLRAADWDDVQWLVNTPDPHIDNNDELRALCSAYRSPLSLQMFCGKVIRKSLSGCIPEQVSMIGECSGDHPFTVLPAALKEYLKRI